MKLPTWDELRRDWDQLDILEHPLDQPLFVAGPPGSGKTVIAVRRALMLADAGAASTVITFNRMLRRLAYLLSNGSISAATMHSFLWRDYRHRTDTEPPMSDADPYAFNWDAILSNLANEGVLPPDECLLIDEGQDLPAEFFRYTASYAASVLTVFADDDQALTERRSTLEEIREAGGLPNPRILHTNHRNAPEVALVAEHFHDGRLPAATVVRSPVGMRPRLVRTEGPGQTAKMIATWAKNRGGSIGVIVQSNPFGAELEKLLKAALPDVRVDRYDSSLKNDDLIDVSEAGITILNKESVKGQEFDTAFVLELENLLPWQTDAMRRVMYMLCARARDYLMLVYGPASLSPDAFSQLPSQEILERS